MEFVFHNSYATLAQAYCIQVCISQLISYACTSSLYSGLYFTTHPLRVHKQFVFRLIFHNSSVTLDPSSLYSGLYFVFHTLYVTVAQVVCILVCISQLIYYACTSSLYSGLCNVIVFWVLNYSAILYLNSFMWLAYIWRKMVVTLKYWFHWLVQNWPFL